MSDADVSPEDALADGLASRIGITIEAVTPTEARGSIPVAGNTQPYGLLHGGASAALAESLGSLAADAHAKTLGPDAIAVGVDLSITHVRGVRAGIVTGVATAIHLGRTVAVYGITLTDESGATSASARLTCAIRTGRAT